MGNYRGDNRGTRSFGGDRGGRGGFGGRGRDFGGNRGGFGGRGGDREMFSTVCSECGKECRVPFRPTNGKPVYCSDCFEKVNGGRDSRRPERNDFAPRPQGNDQSKTQLDAINAKLDKILNILAPTSVVEAVEEKVVSEIKPEKAKKVVKKVASKKKE